MYSYFVIQECVVPLSSLFDAILGGEFGINSNRVGIAYGINDVCAVSLNWLSSK